MFLFLILSLIISTQGIKYTAVKLETELPTDSHYQSAIYDGFDTIFLIGGGKTSRVLENIFSYSIQTGTLTTLGYVPGGGGIAQVDKHGNIFYFGGGDDGASVYRFKPPEEPILVATLPYNVHFGSAVTYNDTQVFITGGKDNCTGIIRFDMETLESFKVGNLSVKVCKNTAVRKGNRAFIFPGEIGADAEIVDIVILDLDTLESTFVDHDILPHTMYHFQAVSDGQFAYIISGYSFSGQGSVIYKADLSEQSIPIQSIQIDNPIVEGDEHYKFSPSPVYVRKQNRIYFFGGLSAQNQTDADMLSVPRLEIWFVDLNPLNMTAWMPEECQAEADLEEEGPTDKTKSSNKLWLWISIGSIFLAISTAGVLGRERMKSKSINSSWNSAGTEITNISKDNNSVWRSSQSLKLVSSEPLGSGSFATVYKANHSILSSTFFAIKKIPLYKALQHLQWDIRKVFREVENLSQIVNPNVVKIYNCWVENSDGEILNENVEQQLRFHEWSSTANYFMFVQMEFCDSNLLEWLTLHRTLGDRMDQNVNCILSQIINGLRGIHQQGIIHRDIKPNNILHKKMGNLWKIGDLGLSTKVNDCNESLSINGCRVYMSPEMICGKTDYDYKTDVFSLGLTFLEIMHPFKDTGTKLKTFENIRSNKFKSFFSEFYPDSKHANILQLISKMLIVNPEERIDILNPLIDQLLLDKEIK